MSLTADPASLDAYAADGSRWSPAPAGAAGRVAVLALLLLAVVAVPFAVPELYINVVSRAAIYGIVALSMNILVGYTGQVSLGHTAFVGVGAFGSGYAITEWGLPFPLAIGFAGLTGAVSAVVLGAVALRLAGLLLALVTIAYGLFAQEVIFNIRSITGGGAGMPAARPEVLADGVAYAVFCFAMLGLALLFDWRLVSSKAGRAIQALRDDERVAASWGIDVARYKILAFTISGVMAGVAGGLFASVEEIVSPQDFSFGLSLTFLLMTVVGGAGNRWGAAQGGLFYASLATLLDRANENWSWWPLSPLFEPVIGSLLALCVLLFFPGGFAQLERPLLRWLSFRRWNEPEIAGGPAARGGGGERP